MSDGLGSVDSGEGIDNGTTGTFSPVDGATQESASDGGNTSGGIFSEGFNFREGWTDDLTGDEFAETRATLANYKDFPTMAKALVDNKRAATARTDGMVKLPGKDSSPEEVAAYHKAIGVPDSPADYKVQLPEKLPEGIDFPESTLNAFTEFAHKNGLSNEVVNKLLEFQATAAGQELSQIQQEQEQAQQQAEQDLQRAWGPKYQQNDMLAKRAGATFGLDPNSELMKNPEVRKAMAQVANAISEDSLVKGESFSANLSPGHEADDILKNPDNPLHGPYHNKDGSYPPEEQDAAINTYLRKLEEQVRREG